MMSGATKPTIQIHRTALSPISAGIVVTIELHRPDVGNALNRDMIDQLAQSFRDVANLRDARLVILAGAGRHFCTGADISWMQEAAQLPYDDNLADARRFETMLTDYCALKMPTMSIVRGSAFGGAMGLLAASDIVIASTNAKFSLSEVRLGLIPAMILPYLRRKVHPAQLLRFALTGVVADAPTMQSAGLVHVVADDADLAGVVRAEIDLILAGAPEAQAQFKQLTKDLDMASDPAAVTGPAIASARTGVEGQAGLNAYFAKSRPPWAAKLPDCEPLPWMTA